MLQILCSSVRVEIVVNCIVCKVSTIILILGTMDNIFSAYFSLLTICVRLFMQIKLVSNNH